MGDIPCLKNLIILTTVIASASFLGASWKLKVKFLSCGELKSNSILGFIIAPVVLCRRFCAPAACPAKYVANAVLVSSVFKAFSTAVLAASMPAPSPLCIAVNAIVILLIGRG